MTLNESAKNSGLNLSKLSNEIELARIVSAILIVSYHTNSLDYKDVSYSGLIYFLLLSGFFSQRKCLTSKSLFKAGIHILRMWMIWTALYGFIRISVHKSFLLNDFPYSLFVGSAIHLWYLPFLVFSFLLLEIFNRSLGNHTSIKTIFLFFVGALLILFGPLWRTSSLLLPTPVPQWIHAIPILIIGAYFGCLDSKKTIAISGAIFLLACIPGLPFAGLGLTYLIGISIFLCSMLSIGILNKYTWIPKISKQSLGIYLIHPLILQILQHQHTFSPSLSFVICIIISYITVAFVHIYLPKFASRIF